MRHTLTRSGGRRMVAAIVSAGLVLSLAAAAKADTVYDTTNGGSVDSPIETITLPVLASTSTTLKMDAPGAPNNGDDHPGCNINGQHSLAMAAVGYDPDVVSVAFLSGDNVFNDCDEELTVTVTAGAAVGSTTVSFVGDPTTASDPHITFSYDEAAFNVNVIEDTTPPPVVCDADPAAPAWANAILRAYGIKNKTDVKNTISAVAGHMGPGAMFDGIEKNNHFEHAYEGAVYAYMAKAKANGGLGLTLPEDADWSLIVRPGWECSPQSS